MELWNWKALQVVNAHERREGYLMDCIQVMIVPTFHLVDPASADRIALACSLLFSSTALIPPCLP